MHVFTCFVADERENENEKNIYVNYFKFTITSIQISSPPPKNETKSTKKNINFGKASEFVEMKIYGYENWNAAHNMKSKMHTYLNDRPKRKRENVYH